MDLLPATARQVAGQHAFGVLTGTAPDLDRREVVLVLDDGPYWFELRGVSVRGTAARIEPPTNATQVDLDWYGITPGRILAWDYGRIRVE